MKHFFSPQIYYHFSPEHELPGAVPPPGSRSSQLVSPLSVCCWGRTGTQECVVTNRSALASVYYVKKSHSHQQPFCKQLNVRFCQKLDWKDATLHWDSLTLKLCLCLTKRSRTVHLDTGGGGGGVQGPLIEGSDAHGDAVIPSIEQRVSKMNFTSFILVFTTTGLEGNRVSAAHSQLASVWMCSISQGRI